MTSLDSHVTDIDLLRSMDGELSDSRAVAVDCHLRECETCRRRQQALEQTATAVSSVYRMTTGSAQAGSAPPVTESRDSLRSRLAQEAHYNPQWWNIGIDGAVVASRRALA